MDNLPKQVLNVKDVKDTTMSKKFLAAVWSVIFTTAVLLPLVTEGKNHRMDYLLPHPEARQILRNNPLLERELNRLLRGTPADAILKRPDECKKFLRMRGIDERELDRLFELISDNESVFLKYQRDLSNVRVSKFSGQTLTEAERQSIGVILADFQVNENVGRCDHYSPEIALTNNGTFIITWRDVRNVDSDIYCQLYNSDSTAIGCNFMVNDNKDNSSYSNYNPTIGVDSNGGFVIAWEGYYNWNEYIYYQRYDANGTALGSNFIVNDDVGSIFSVSNPTIDMDSSGSFVIAWVGNYDGYVNIYCQRYDSDGTALGSNFMVNDDGISNFQYNPTIDMNRIGDFVIAWEDNRNGYNEIYCQGYDANGTAIGANFKVNDDGSSGSKPNICIDGSSNFVIVWEDTRSGYDNIYCQRYDANRTTIGANFKVNDDGSSGSNPNICVDGSGNFVIVWRYKYNIYCQRYNADGIAIESYFVVNNYAGSRIRNPAIDLDNNGNLVVAWADDRNVIYDIYCQRYDTDNTALGSNFMVNDDEGSSKQDNPTIGVDESGNFVIVWRDSRNDNNDLYCQRYTANGTVLDSNFIVNDDTRGWQDNPTICVDGSGNFIIVCTSSSNVYCQRYDKSGIALGSNFVVNDYKRIWSPDSPTIGVDDNGNFVIAWSDWCSENDDIYCQRYDADGIALGSNFIVNDNKDNSRQIDPTIGVDDNGNFVIAWSDWRSENQGIYCQRYDADGTTLGANFMVNDNDGSSNQWYPTIGVDDKGNFVIAWEDYRNDSGYWTNPDIYTQRYDIYGTEIGSNFILTTSDESTAQIAPSVALNNGKIFTVWQDSRIPGQGWDIFANVLSFYPTEMILSVPSLYSYPMGSVLVTLYIIFPPDSTFNSAEISVGGYFGLLNFIEVDTSNSLMGRNSWTYEIQEIDTVLHLTMHGTEDIYGGGTLCRLKYAVPATATSGFIPITLVNAVFNAGEIPVELSSGGITVCEPATADFTGEPTEGASPLTVVFKDSSLGSIENWTWNFGDGTDTSYTSFADSIIHVYETIGTYTVSLIASSPVNVDTLIKTNYITIIKSDLGGDNETQLGIPAEFSLDQNHPNPFNPTTNIIYSIPKRSHVNVKIYDLLGREVVTLVNKEQEAKYYKVSWDATDSFGNDVSSGMYLYRIVARSTNKTFVKTKKLLLLR